MFIRLISNIQKLGILLTALVIAPILRAELVRQSLVY
ncbi:hypothetical protein NTHI1209_01408 [Haemophilus influenzae]|uniref:Uncharacterized protein n=1 Tax=Haemophilus influenzae TaxID=727 RepID=A0A158SY52_HAEIF|nr:hypothetical protein NTHI1209_01408 [Haemophilus influenzae]